MKNGSILQQLSGTANVFLNSLSRLLLRNIRNSAKNMVTISARKRLWKSMLLPVKSKKALVAFSGIDAPPYQSGQVDIRSSRISKRGYPALRRTLFLVMSVIKQRAHADDPVYLFMNRKRAEGKPLSRLHDGLCQ